MRPDEAGLRLDKYLAAPDRLGSRARAFAGLERGKVFLDGGEAGVANAATRCLSNETFHNGGGSANIMSEPGRGGATRPPPGPPPVELRVIVIVLDARLSAGFAGWISGGFHG